MNKSELQSTIEHKYSPLPVDLIDDIAESMPDGVEGFMRKWGWQQFARRIEQATIDRMLDVAETTITELKLESPRWVDTGMEDQDANAKMCAMYLLAWLWTSPRLNSNSNSSSKPKTKQEV